MLYIFRSICILLLIPSMCFAQQETSIAPTCQRIVSASADSAIVAFESKAISAIYEAQRYVGGIYINFSPRIRSADKRISVPLNKGMMNIIRMCAEIQPSGKRVCAEEGVYAKR